MKTKTYLIFLLAIIAASCSSLQQSTVNDDIYYSPKDQVIANNKLNVDNLQRNNSSTIFGNNYDQQITDILEDESINEIDTTIVVDDSEINSFKNIIVDDYDEAWERRQNARNSLYYGSNYLFITTTDAYRYASIYANDPYYNVVIIGDQVWVEPRYISSSFGYWPPRAHYNSLYFGAYYDPFYYGYSPYYNSYYSSYYYNPYYSYYNPYKTYYSVNNDNYASSSFHSYRQRSLSSTSVRRSTSDRISRELPETYAGRDVRSSSTVKSGLDRQAVRQERTDGTLSRTRTSNVATPRVVTEGTRTRVATSNASNRNYTRPQSTSRSTYNATSRSTTRYNRPASSNANSSSSQGVSRSTYTPNRNATAGSRSGSSNNQRTSSSSSVKSSSNRSSGSSSSVRSSGSSSRSSGSSTRSSGSSGRSSGSSSKSSGSSSRSGGGRR